MAEAKVTRKELFARIAEVMADDAEVVEMCDKYIASLEKSAARPRKPDAELMDFRNAVATWLAEQTEPVTQAIAGEALGVTGPKAGAALRWLVGQGMAVAYDGKGKNPKTYAMA